MARHHPHAFLRQGLEGLGKVFFPLPPQDRNREEEGQGPLFPGLVHQGDGDL
ncbi:hypothetical protein ACFS5K_11945 [Thermus tengchongensis]